MSEIKKPKFTRFANYAVLILLVAYVLSIGPAFAVATNSRWSSDGPYVSAFNAYKSFDSFYAPLLWVGKKIRFIDEIISDYEHYCFKTMYPDTYSSLNSSE